MSDTYFQTIFRDMSNSINSLTHIQITPLKVTQIIPLKFKCVIAIFTIKIDYYHLHLKISQLKHLRFILQKFQVDKKTNAIL